MKIGRNGVVWKKNRKAVWKKKAPKQESRLISRVLKLTELVPDCVQMNKMLLIHYIYRDPFNKKQKSFFY